MNELRLIIGLVALAYVVWAVRILRELRRHKRNYNADNG